MTTIRYLYIFIISSLSSSFLFAHLPLGSNGKPLPNVAAAPKANNRDQCSTAKSQTDIEINNVRARLQGGGDIWWDFKVGRYIVPKPGPGVTPVASFYAGGIWIGGVDAGGNLKTACTTYRTWGNDWFSGPLEFSSGATEARTCANWDKHFRVLGADINKARAAYASADKDGNGRVNDPAFLDLLSKGVKGWPAKGNPYFTEVWGFTLPASIDYLANFWDRNGDQVYDPADGDYPSIYVRGCDDAPQTADEIVFWVFNDEGGGGSHTSSKGKAIRMEVQVQAFAYATNDELNNMTFMHYRLINRASEKIDSMFFAMWADPDVGCFVDDYVGCDTTRGPNGLPRNLMYMYNVDEVDGNPGTACQDGSATYGTKIPIVGVDYFRGPLDPRILVKNPKTGLPEPKEIGMSSFMYYNNGGVGGPPQATWDPIQVIDFYRYLNSVWKDGTPLTTGGSGYNIAGTGRPTKYAMPGDPDDGTSWCMVNSNLPGGDRKTIQASGPFLLNPGAINELIVGIPWVPDQGGGKVSLLDMRSADDVAQDLFDRCFRILDGPDAPDLVIIELENHLVLTLTNNSFSNNFREQYGKSSKLPIQKEVPSGWFYNKNQPDSFYTFEGYKVYQLAGPEVSYDKSLVDAGSDKIRLVSQVDISNDVKKIYNWTSIPDPFNVSSPAYYPVLQVEASNSGLKHTFKVDKDLFAKGDNKTLINHKKYYFAVVAYSHNNFSNFDKNAGIGQKRAYLEGRNNVKTYIAIPRPIVDRNLKSSYGDGAVITRLDGVGIGGNFVEMSDETRNKIMNGTFDEKITYKAGRGPITINIYNPLEVKDGDYELSFFDNTPNDITVDVDSRWKLTRKGDTGSTISEETIQRLNEQIIAKYGFSIAIAQSPEFASDPIKNASNGTIAVPDNVKDIEYKDPAKSNWFGAITDGIQPGFDFVTNLGLEDLGATDPKQKLSTSILGGQFVPYSMCAYKLRTAGTVTDPFASPGWVNTRNAAFYASNKSRLANVNNVDIVLTSDKSKWSRCIVVETCNQMYADDGLLPKGFADPNRASMSLRQDESKGSDTDPNGPTDGTKGKSWFPGYAIDVETGTRLEIFFGENSGYDLTNNPGLSSFVFSSTPTGGDMIWNPTADTIVNLRDQTGGPAQRTASNLAAGCGHYIYVTDQPYSNWKADFDILTSNPNSQQNVVKNIRWASMPVLSTATKLLSYSEGIIPNDVTLKLRVDNPYQVAKGTGANNNYPIYNFSLNGVQTTDLSDGDEKAGALDAIKVIPNPYYAYSAYEINQFSNTVKIANLPASCVITIYSLDGKFIRQYKRDEVPSKSTSSNPGVNLYQITPALEWDLKNSKGIPIAGGTYIIHINAPGLGEKTIKWFGVLRPFDPTGL